jgi:hypothetical protein
VWFDIPLLDFDHRDWRVVSRGDKKNLERHGVSIWKDLDGKLRAQDVSDLINAYWSSEKSLAGALRHIVDRKEYVTKVMMEKFDKKHRGSC